MADWCIHIANVLYLLSFVGRDMLWLRALQCAGLVFGLIFFTCSQPLHGPSFWHVVFLIINLYQIKVLLGDRRRMRLSREQENLSRLAFENLSREELVHLLSKALTHPPKVDRIPAACREELTEDEQVLKHVVLERLSRGEIVNLLTRRMWGSLKRLKPWRRERTVSP